MEKNETFVCPVCGKKYDEKKVADLCCKLPVAYYCQNPYFLNILEVENDYVVYKIDKTAYIAEIEYDEENETSFFKCEKWRNGEVPLNQCMKCRYPSGTTL